MVYIREAHPTNGWQMESNLRDGVLIPEPLTAGERQEVARLCRLPLGLTLPTLLDTMDNATEQAYQAWPERLYVLSSDGRIAYQGGKGPFHFDPDELARFLESYVK